MEVVKQVIKDFKQEQTDVKPQVPANVIMELKAQVEQVYNYLVTMSKKVKKTKKSIKALKVMSKFLNCHLDCPTIYDKYVAVMDLMREYANEVKEAKDANNIG